MILQYFIYFFLFILYTAETKEEIDSEEDSDRWCIIGAGFAGLSMGSTFQQKGVPFTIYERDTQIGGNWQQGT